MSATPSRPPLRIANLLGPQAGMLLRALPSRPDVLDLEPDRIREIPPDRTALFVLQRAADGTTLERPAAWPGGIHWVQIASAGVDEYPAWVLDAPIVTSAQGVTNRAIAEFVLTMLLTHEKRVPALFVHDAAGWPGMDEARTDQLGTLRGKTLGMLGAGTIGVAIAELATAFGMRVVAARRSGRPVESAGATISVAPLDETLAAADHFVVAAPLTSETRGLLDDAAFAKLKRGAHLVNIARGAILDQDALLRALERDPALTATLDVTEPEPLPSGHPLYAHPRVRISPHRSFGSPRTMENLVRLFTENVAKYVAGEPLRNVVDRARGY